MRTKNKVILAKINYHPVRYSKTIQVVLGHITEAYWELLQGYYHRTKMYWHLHMQQNWRPFVQRIFLTYLSCTYLSLSYSIFVHVLKYEFILILCSRPNKFLHTKLKELLSKLCAWRSFINKRSCMRQSKAFYTSVERAL